MGSLQYRRQLNGDAFVAESYAFLLAVQFCIDADFSNIFFEGDALKVVKEALGDELSWSTGGTADSGC